MTDSSQISVRQQTTDSGSSGDTKKDKYQKKKKTKLHIGISFSNYRKSKINKKSWKKPEGRDTLPTEEQSTSPQKPCKEWSEIFKVLRE